MPHENQTPHPASPSPAANPSADPATPAPPRRVAPRHTEDVAREDIPEFVKNIANAIHKVRQACGEIQELILGQEPESWGAARRHAMEMREALQIAMGTAEKIASYCEITRDVLTERKITTPLPFPTPLDMTGFAPDLADFERKIG